MVVTVVLVASISAVAIGNFHQVVIVIVCISDLISVRQRDLLDPLVLVHLYGESFPGRGDDSAEIKIRIIHQLRHVSVDVCDRF